VSQKNETILSMTPRLTTDYAKNYCNRTLIVQVVLKNVVTCFFGTQCIYATFMLKSKSRHNQTQVSLSGRRWQ